MSSLATTTGTARRRWRGCLGILALLLGSLALGGCTGQPQGWAGPIVTATTAYVASPEGKLLALDLAARSQGAAFPASNEWQFPSEKDRKLGPIYATPTLSDTSLYVASYNGKVYAIEAATGRQRWEFPPTGAVGNVVASPTVANNTAYVSTSDYQVYALDAATGQATWEKPFRARNKVWAGVTLDEADTAFVASLDHHVYALERGSGRVKWEFSTDGAIASAPLYAQGLLYAGSADGKLYALDAATGRKQWEYDAQSWLWASPLMKDGTLYVGSLAGQVYALDAATGQLKWPQPVKTGGPVSVTPVLVAGVLAVASQDGRVYGLDPESGQQKWLYATNPGSPIFASLASDGTTLYVQPLGQKLLTLDGRTGTAAGKWVFPTNGWPG